MKTLMISTATALIFAASPAIAQDAAPEEPPTFGTEYETGDPIFTDDSDNASTTDHKLSYKLSKLWDQQVLGDDVDDIAIMSQMIKEPVAYASSSETKAEIETIEEPVGLGGPYYASEEDVARDAVLTPETE